MLIAPANVRGDYFENYPVLALTIPDRKLRIINRSDFYFSLAYVGNSSITSHVLSP
jgi:hypothetical protein